MDKQQREAEQPAAIMATEAGDIGDEQMPGGVKTDKEEWTYCADKVKKEPLLPKWLREFLAGL